MIKNYLKTTLLFCLFCLSADSFCQNDLNNLDAEYEELILKKRGPNKDHYGHLYLGYGFLLGDSDSDSAQIKNYQSSSFSLGWLSKWRINKWYELGFDVTYYYSSFHLVQDSFKIVPNNVQHKREKLVFNNVQIVPFQRFKFRNRHHSTGTFIDLGFYGGYNYRVKNQSTERNRAPGAGKTKTVNLDLDYTQDFSYGLIARFGLNRVVFYGRYRVSDLFTPNSNLPELPRFDVGFLIGIHQ